MSELDEIVRRIKRDLAADYEARLRAALSGKDPAWLTDELVSLLVERDLGVESAAPADAPGTAIDEAAVREFIDTRADVDRARLLRPDAPAKGTALLAPEHLTAAGMELLDQTRQMLSALLFGDDTTGVVLDRAQPELLTVMLPRAKANALDFLRASTELAAVGTWHDPEDVSDDERADNVVLEVQFGEVASELVGSGVMTALRLINELEINEQVLYARMVNLEETSLPG